MFGAVYPSDTAPGPVPTSIGIWINDRFFSMSPAVPQEIVDQILDFIPDTTDGLEALKSASLVCHSFRPSACARLFRHIDLWDTDSEPTKLDILLQRAPHLVHYVQVLRIIGGLGLFETSTTLPTSLKALRSEGSHRVTLRRIELYGVDWKNISSGMKAVLPDLLACSSLCGVRLRNVSNYPPNLIDRLPPTVNSLDVSQTDIPLIKTLRRLLQVETLTVQLSITTNNRVTKDDVLQTPVGWVTHTRLRSLKLSTCDTTLWPVYRAIIQHASSSLEELYILINIRAEHFNSVDFGRFPRIRKIIIMTPRLRSWLICLASFRAAIVWLSQSLSNMSPNNNMDHVTIRFCIAITHGNVWDAPQFDAGIERAAWESLDETLSQPHLASSKIFRGISLEICTDIQDIYDYLDGLVLAKLPRMERSKRIHVTKERFSAVRYGIERP